jgi:hypothetical protein
LFFIAGLLSRPDNFWMTFNRVLAFVLLGMALGGTGGSIAITITIVCLPKLLNAAVGAKGGIVADGWVLIYGGPLLMFFGQVVGAVCGLKRRWGAQEEQLRAGILQAFWLCGLIGLGAGITAGVLTGVQESLARRIYDATPVMQPIAGWAGGATAGVLAAFVVSCISFYLLPPARWSEGNRRLGVGCAFGVVLATGAFAWDMRHQLHSLFSRGYSYTTYANPILDDLLYFPIYYLPIGIFTAGVLSLIPLWLGQWWRVRTARAPIE